MNDCRCPYCMKPLEIDKVKYFIRREDKINARSARMREFLKPTRMRQEDDPFYRFWIAYNRTITPEVLDNRIVKSDEEMLMARGIFAADAEQKRKDAKIPAGSEEIGQDVIRPGQGAGRSLVNADDADRSICEIRKEQTPGEPAKFTIWEDGRRIAITKAACPACYNVLPEEIFRLPMIRIALAAGKFGGKTCLALSWFRTLEDFRGGLNARVNQMDFVSMLEANRGMDDEFSAMLKEFVEQDICPAPTNEQFIPPIFLKLNYKGYRGGKHEAIVGIYDAAGETLTGSVKDDELVSYMTYMDGIIYMIEPSKTGIQRGITNQNMLIDNAAEESYRQEGILTLSEQIKKQMNSYSRTTLADLLGDITLVRKNRSNEVIRALRGYTDGERLRQMHVALTISKCDELRGNTEIRNYDGGGMLFLNAEDMDPNMEGMREEHLKKLFEEKVFNLDMFKNVFGSMSYHMIAALGCPTEVDETDAKGRQLGSTAMVKPKLKGDFSPIRVEEPLLKIISIYAEEHEWNK